MRCSTSRKRGSTAARCAASSRSDASRSSCEADLVLYPLGAPIAPPVLNSLGQALEPKRLRSRVMGPDTENLRGRRYAPVLRGEKRSCSEKNLSRCPGAQGPGPGGPGLCAGGRGPGPRGQTLYMVVERGGHSSGARRRSTRGAGGGGRRGNSAARGRRFGRAATRNHVPLGQRGTRLRSNSHPNACIGSRKTSRILAEMVAVRRRWGNTWILAEWTQWSTLA